MEQLHPAVEMIPQQAPMSEAEPDQPTAQESLLHQLAQHLPRPRFDVTDKDFLDLVLRVSSLVTIGTLGVAAIVLLAHLNEMEYDDSVTHSHPTRGKK